MNNDRMNMLPNDILNIILEYQGYHMFRNGKFMTRIMKNDERYSMLKTRPAILPETYNVNFKKNIGKRCFDFDISVIIENEKLYWFMFVKRYYDEKGMFDEQWQVDWKNVFHTHLNNIQIIKERKK
jgi:hypothetical protein